MIDATLKAFAATCDCAADTARSIGSTNKVKVQKASYQEIRKTFDLSANLTIRAISNIATDSDDKRHSSADVERVRRKYILQLKRLQRKGTKGAKKTLKRVSGKEARFRRHENHVVSKTLGEIVGRAGRGTACENLKGICGRIRAMGGAARHRLSGWSFHQLSSFLACKAERAGMPVVRVSPRNMSRMCSDCGDVEKSKRRSQAEFQCKACGHKSHTDESAARNNRVLAVPLNAATELATAEPLAENPQGLSPAEDHSER